MFKIGDKVRLKSDVDLAMPMEIVDNTTDNKFWCMYSRGGAANYWVLDGACLILMDQSTPVFQPKQAQLHQNQATEHQQPFGQAYLNEPLAG